MPGLGAGCAGPHRGHPAGAHPLQRHRPQQHRPLRRARGPRDLDRARARRPQGAAAPGPRAPAAAGRLLGVQQIILQASFRRRGGHAQALRRQCVSWTVQQRTASSQQVCGMSAGACYTSTAAVPASRRMRSSQVCRPSTLAQRRSATRPPRPRQAAVAARVSSRGRGRGAGEDGRAGRRPAGARGGVRRELERRPAAAAVRRARAAAAARPWPGRPFPLTPNPTPAVPSIPLPGPTPCWGLHTGCRPRALEPSRRVCAATAVERICGDGGC